MAIQLKIIGFDKLKGAGSKFKEARARLTSLVGMAAQEFANDALSRIKKDYLSGPRPEKLGVVTGNLRSKMRFLINQGAKGVEIKFGTDVPYAAIHEFGGVTGKGHKTVIEKRPFLRPGIEDALPKFEARVQSLVEQVVLEAGSGK